MNALTEPWYCASVRVWTLLAALATSSVASADRLIEIPTAHKIPFGSIQYEVRYEPRIEGVFEHYLGAGLGPSWELEYRQGNIDSDRVEGTLDLTYNLLSPVTDLFPGLSFGVQDLLNRTQDGRKPFLAATFREGFFVIGGEVAADFTLGIGYVHTQVLPFVGASIPFSPSFRLLVEHDGQRISAGFQIDPAKFASLKILLRENNSIISLAASHRFRD